MLKFSKRTSHKAGLAPGTLVHIGEKMTDEVVIRLIDYDRENLREASLQAVEEALPLKESPTVSWIDLVGLHDTEVIAEIGNTFSLHPLILEDIAHTGQRPKIEEYDELLFVVLKMIEYSPKHELSSEQISLVVGPNILLSFQEKEGDVFNGVRDRIRKGNPRIRRLGTDYLCYALLDAIVDNYFLVMEAIEGKIEDLEEELLAGPTENTLHEIHRLRRNIIFLRRSIWPLREVVNTLSRGDFPQISEETEVFYRDVYDHTVQVMDAVETFRDVISSMVDMYMSSISNKMNEVMKILTIIATIFIPVTFVAGIYGMNFEFMPELGWRWGYFAAWGIMLALIITMVIFFKRKKWL